MNDDLREAIKLCKECPTPITPQWRLILTTAEQVLEAGESLPDEIKTEFLCLADHYLHCKQRLVNCPYPTEEFNRAVRICTPILAKKNIRIKELEERIKKLEDCLGDAIADGFKGIIKDIYGR